MNENTTYDGRTAFENAQVGDVIRVPQYEGALEVVHDGRDAGMLGIEFVEDGRGSASKHLIQNENSGRVYLTAGTADKGEVEEVEVVSAVEREDEDDPDDEPADEDDESPTLTLDLPDYGNVVDYADSVDLSELSDDELERLDARLSDMLNGDPFAFPSDAALWSASDLSAAIRDEFEARDRRRDDPHFTPHDSEERYSLDLSAVEVEHAPATTHVRLTFSDGSEWTTRPGLDIANLVRDYLGLDDLRAIGTCIGQSLPVVGHETGNGWSRLDRYALEHDGTTALDDEDDDEDDYEGDNEDKPELVTDGGVPVAGGTPEPADEAKLLRVRGEADGISTLSVYYEAAGETFRARLRPVRPLPEEDHIRDREALILSDLSTVEDVGGPGVEWFDTTHVPAVVRRAVDRPVQVPARGH
jgi:hypothetical protein